LKKSSYLCKTNREDSKNVPEVINQMVWNPDNSSLIYYFIRVIFFFLVIFIIMGRNKKEKEKQKVRFGISISPEINKTLDSLMINKSKLIESLLKKYLDDKKVF
jgi:hypothetical protein